MAKVVGFIGIRRPDSRINSLAHLHLASTPCEQLSPQWQYRVLLGSSSHNLLCSQIPPAQQFAVFAAVRVWKHIQDSDRRRKIDVLLHTEMKLSLTSARLYPTACPVQAMSAIFRNRRHRLGPNGEMPSGRFHAGAVLELCLGRRTRWVQSCRLLSISVLPTFASFGVVCPGLTDMQHGSGHMALQRLSSECISEHSSIYV